MTVLLTTGATGCDLLDSIFQALFRAGGPPFVTREAPRPERLPLRANCDAERILAPVNTDTTLGLNLERFDRWLVAGEGSTNPLVTRRVRVLDTQFSNQTQLLTPNFARSPDPLDPVPEFGQSVAGDGNTLIVGCPSAYVGDPPAVRGGVFVYGLDATPSGTNVQFQQVIAPPPNEVSIAFGRRVAIDGDVLAVSQSPSRVHVYTRSGNSWTFAQTLRSQVPLQDSYGAALDVDGDRIAVGSPSDVVEGSAVGAVHIFELEEGIWQHRDELHGSYADEQQQFGAALELAGDVLIVGAPGALDEDGFADIFEFDVGSWRQRQTLDAGLLEVELEFGRFGHSIALDAEHLAIGVPATSDGGYVVTYERSFPRWERADTWCVGNFQEPVDGFGSAVAVSGPTVYGAARGPQRAGIYSDAEPAALRATGTAKKPAQEPLNEYLGFRPEPGVPPQSGEYLVPRDVQAPFRVQVRAGVLSAAHDVGLAGSRFVVGLRNESDWAVTGTFVAGGLSLVATGPDGPLGTPTAFPGVRLVDVAARDDGTQLVFSARAFGASGFIELARTPSTGTAQLRPFMRAEDVPAGGEIGFDDPVIEETTPEPPSTASLRNQVLDCIVATLAAEATTQQLELDGPATGIALATAMARAEQAMATATAVLAAPGKRRARTGPRPALGKLRKAAKALAAARRKLEKGKSARAVSKQLGRALKREQQALKRLGS